MNRPTEGDARSANSAAAGRGGAWPAVRVLCWREIVRFLRQRNRVIGAIGQPLLFWLLFGPGLKQTFRLAPTELGAGQSFQQYYFPGTIMLILLFTAIFTTISVIEDRREGFLQSVLVAPVPRWSLVLGKVLGGTLLALFQALIFLALAFTMQVELIPLNLLAVVALLFVSAVALTSLGLVIAWPMQSTQGFHAIMSLVLMPLWLLSGAFFPVPQVGPDASTLEWAMSLTMQANPMTYGVAGLRQLLFPNLPAEAMGLPSLWICWLVTVVFALITFAGAWMIAGRRTVGDAR